MNAVIHASLLGLILATCSSHTNPQTIAAVIEHESGSHPWAIHDNTDGKPHYPQTYADAVRLAERLNAEGHSIDMGLGQINNSNLSWLHATIPQIFIPCNNVWAADTILCSSWKTVVHNIGRIALFEPDRYAYRMLGIYHSNSMNDPRYENAVVPLATGSFVRRTVMYYHWWKQRGVHPVVHGGCHV